MHRLAFHRCRRVARMPNSQVFEPLLAGLPPLIVSASRTASSDSLRPIEAIGGACSQSPEWLDDAARSLALSTSHWAIDWSKDACFVAINLSPAFWMCCLFLAGVGELDSASNTISVEATDWSGTDLMFLGRMDSWRVSVEEEEEEIYLPRTITILNKKNTVLKLACSRLPEKQKAIYAGRQHC